MATRGRPKPLLDLTDSDARSLRALVAARSTSQSMALRARVILLSAEGRSNKAIAVALGTSIQTVGKWRKAYIERGLGGLQESPRSGAPKRIGQSEIERIILATIELPPPESDRWSTRLLAKHIGVSHDTIHRVWRRAGLKPHTETLFQLASVRPLNTGLREVTGVYIRPRDHAIVISRVGASARVASGSPANPMRRPTRSAPQEDHDDCRDFFAYVRSIAASAPRQVSLHVIVDSRRLGDYGPLRFWLRRRRRVQLHVIPTLGSWLLQVERWFSTLSGELEEEGFTQLPLLRDALVAHLSDGNNSPDHFVWNAYAKAGSRESVLLR